MIAAVPGAAQRRFATAAFGAVLVPVVSAMLTAADSAPVCLLLEMRQERVVIQQWDLSCGAAALATTVNQPSSSSR